MAKTPNSRKSRAKEVIDAKARAAIVALARVIDHMEHAIPSQADEDLAEFNRRVAELRS